MKKITKYLYEDTGMFIDWSQLNQLPEIDTFIDIGVGVDGTPEFYNRFPNSKLILIDPLEESKEYAEKNLCNRDYSFFNFAVGDKDSQMVINIEEEIGRSTLLDVTQINYEGLPIKKRTVLIKRLDDLIKNHNSMGSFGIKIDTEGFELNVIRGARNILKFTNFLVAEVRHNHESFRGQYKLHEFMNEMQNNGFILTNIITAKPLIADLCFQPLSKF